MTASTSWIGRTWRRIPISLRRSPLALAGAVWLILLVVASLLASHVAPYGPLIQNLNEIHSGPTLQHLLGTDSLGRDILSRLMFGGSAMVVGAVLTTIVAVAVGWPAGIAAGYLGGRLDALISWVADLSFALPAIVILVAVSVISPDNLLLLTLCLGVIASGSVVRLVRNSAMGVRDAGYVDAARVAGVPRRTIMFRHVLPTTGAPLIVLSTQIMSVAVVLLTALSYLGLGGSPEQPSWGAMISDASANISTDPWLLVPTGGVLILTVLALTFIGSTVRDALIPDLPEAASLAPRPLVAVTEVTMPVSDGADGSSSKALLRVRDLTVAFPRSGGLLPVVDGVSFSLTAGTTVGLVGETGCGKSVTALSIPDLLGSGGRRTGGSVHLGDLELSALSERQWRDVRGNRIGFISQEPLVALDPSFTVQSQLSEVIRRHRSVNRSEANALVQTMLGEVGITEAAAVAARYPHELSGGMAQRVSIALALSGQPELLIADEPTTALDVTVQAGILDLLRDLVARTNMALLLVTHDFGVVADICDRVVVMYAGQVVEEGPVDQVLSHPRHPYTMALLRSRPELGTAGQELATIAGRVPAPEEWPTGCRFAERCPYATTACRVVPVVVTTVDGHGARCIRQKEIADELMMVTP
ncbi:MAG TPA: dipeptide/oligopeptide/nickel ABC transporter permease/ATP-binding protein [Acidimicrobiales bacterium]